MVMTGLSMVKILLFPTYYIHVKFYSTIFSKTNLAAELSILFDHIA